MLSLQSVLRDNSCQEKAGLKILSDVEIQQIQQVLLEIYRDILFFCKKYNLSVLLGGGSALGAVRHGGFIPWDDDIDLIMIRKDYNLFMEVFLKEFADKYDLSSPVSDKRCSDSFIKVTKKGTLKTGMFKAVNNCTPGLCVDIFPIDYVPDNILKRYLKGFFCNALIFIINSKVVSIGRTHISDRYFFLSKFMKLHYYFRIMVGTIFSFIPYFKICVYYNKLISYSKKSALLTISPGRKHYFGEMFPYDVFFPPMNILFEGVEAYIPNQYDRYLRNLYGSDYMRIPPKEKREPHICKELKII